jgi:hypothetical protein
MNLTSRSWKMAGVGVFALVALTACLVGGYGGADVGVGVGYAGAVYEPGGYEYGGWGPAYRVGPPRGVREERGGRPARSAPSIPRGARGGGGHKR